MTSEIISRDFDTHIAKDVGTDAAIIFQNIWFWVSLNRQQESKSHFFEGKYWTYNTVKGFNSMFYYLTPAQIRRCLEKLIEKKYIITGNFNQTAYDRTTWYAIGENSQIHLLELTNGSDQNHQPIPDDNPNDKPDMSEQPIIKTPEEFVSVVGGDPLVEFSKHKEEVRAKKKTPFLGYGGGRMSSPRPAYPKKERTIADGRGIR